MASEVDICNRALQKLGASRITALDENTPNAVACNFNYTIIRDREFRKHLWNFTLKRVTLAASSTTPDFGFSYAFPLPSDWIRNNPPNDVDVDWKIEGRSILTSAGDTLELPYVSRVTDTTQFDELFNETLACALALEMCEEITQSNTKKDILIDEYKRCVMQAKQVDAIEVASDEPVEDPWITARL
jgi:hypothetical protein